MRKKGNFLWLNWRFSLTYLANQTQNLSAILQNFSTAIRATETAYNSAGSAAEENSRYMESLGAKLTAVKSSFQELANSVVNSELVSTILDLVNGFLELLNSGIGPTIVQLGLLAGVLTGGITLFGQFGSAVAGSISTFGKLIKVFVTATSGAGLLSSAASALGVSITGMGTAAAGASVGFAALSAAAGGIAIAITAVVGIVSAVRAVFDALTVTYEEAAEKAQELNAEIENLSGAGSEYETLANKAGKLTEQQKEQLELLKQQKQELSEQGKDTSGIDEQINKYNDIILSAEELTEYERKRLTYLEAQLEIQKQQLAIEYQQQYDIFRKEQSGNPNQYKSFGTYWDEEAHRYQEIAAVGTQAELSLIGVQVASMEASKAFKDSGGSLDTLKQSLVSIVDEYQDYYDTLVEIEKIAEITGDETMQLNEYEETAKDTIELFIAVLAGGEETLRAFAEGQIFTAEQAYAFIDALEKEQDTVTSAISSLQQLGLVGENITGTSEAIAEATKNWSDYAEQLEILKTATDEYNQSGGISVSTLQSLLSISPDLLMQWAQQKGQLDLNKLAADNLSNSEAILAQTMIQESVASYAASEGARLQAEMLAEAQTASEDAKTPMDRLSGSLLVATNEAIASAEAMGVWGASASAAAKAARDAEAGGDGSFADYFRNEWGLADEYLDEAVSNVTNYQKTLVDLVNSVVISTGSAGAGLASSAGSAASSAASSYVDTWKEAFDQQVADLEHSLAMDYITEEEYYNQLMALVEKYLAGRKEYLDEYRRYEEEFYEWQKEQAEEAAEAVAEAQKTAFEDYIDYKEHLLNMNVISEEQYYAELEEQIRNYWAIGVLSAEEYRDYLEELYDWQLSQLEDAADAMKDAYDDLVSETEDQFDAVMDYVSDYADEQITALEKEYDALQDQIDAVNDKYDEQLDKLEAENDELDKQIQRQQLLDALAKAREQRLYVYKEGEGFTYMQDVDAIAEAQEALDEFDREQMIEDEKDLIEQNRENELKYLEDEQAALEAEIERWEQYKEGWADIVDNYEKTQNELIAQQILGTKLEGTNWNNRLNILENFTNMYTQFQDELLSNQESVTQIEQWNWNERLQNLKDFYDQYLAILDQINDLETPLQPGEATDDYWYGDIGADYAALMEQSKSIQEFQYWAQQRLYKIQAAGIDLEEKGWATNEEIYQKWLQSMGGVAPSNPDWQAPTTGGEDYHPLYGTEQNPNVSNGVSYDPDVDYAEKMLAASTRDEFNYWAERRIAKALGEGIDIFSGQGWATNEDLLQKWLQSKGYNILASSANTMSLLSGSGYDTSQTAARNLVSTAGYSGGNSTTSYSFAIDNLSLPNATDANSLVSGLRNMAQQYSTQRSYSY